ncbi:hydrolase [Collibacillus ludicampi]|uniref:Hydrolase n=1 Tax=Collibacillus ludicampi TaxID=2771369 RepID=A0AAV4LJI5_9BACL|nr:C40 family peptidase [Collibacillus ludicampi]GIM47929.1 hydrolase [Collibacillus ludicampi]
MKGKKLFLSLTLGAVLLAGNAVVSTSVYASAGDSSHTSSYQNQDTTLHSLPHGVKLDRSITPIASLDDDHQTKLDAVLQVAESKLGTPYRWGHNEDRGQYGFDCSNFTAYVYHHALGYKFSGSSRVQARSVGNPVPKSQMRPGDLLIFDGGRHVGIYAGNGRMIQEGGGLGRVGYLSVAPGSYWSKHITAVKRMF